MKEFSIIACVVLFHPDADMVINNINKYGTSVDKLYIWDNTPSLDTSHGIAVDNIVIKQKLLNIWGNDKCQFISTGKNEGLSWAYNECYRFAKKEGFTHILTMDQDSEWEDFDKYKKFVKEYSLKKQAAIIGPVINDEKQATEVSMEPNIINSGAVIPLSVFDKIGGFCERFLIDAIDVEFGCRAHRFNIPVLKIKGHGRLIQRFGDKTFFRFRNKDWYCLNYTAKRLRGISRNLVITARIYPDLTGWNYIRDVVIRQYSIAIILKEKNKFRKLFALYKGLVDGFLTKKSIDSRYSKL